MEEPFVRIVVLDSEPQAHRVEAELRSRNIPFRLQSYHDSAYDGLFQGSLGWGAVEAPERHRDEIVRMAEDMRSPGPEDTA